MVDIIDRANDLMQQNLDAALSNHKKNKYFSVDCVECGCFISAERQKATGGTDLCIDCQEIEESLEKRGLI